MHLYPLACYIEYNTSGETNGKKLTNLKKMTTDYYDYTKLYQDCKYLFNRYSIIVLLFLFV